MNHQKWLAGISVLSICALLRAQPPAAQMPTTGYCPPPCKICVSERKEKTRHVFSAKYEEYCVTHCSLWSWLCGCCGGDEGPCGDLRTRHRLIVKKVRDCDGRQCVPREVKEGPFLCAPCYAPAPPMGGPPIK